MISTTKSVLPIPPAMIESYRNNLDTITNLLCNWLNDCGLISSGIIHENISKRMMNSQLKRLFKHKTDVFIVVYVGMSTLDGSWLFKDGVLNLNDVLQMMEETSPGSQLCVLVDTPNTEPILKKLHQLDGRVIIQTKRRDENLELGNETNGKFLIEWLRWNSKNRREPKDWLSSIR